MIRDSKGRFAKAPGFKLEMHRETLADQALTWMDANADGMLAILIMGLVQIAVVYAMVQVPPIVP